MIQGPTIPRASTSRTPADTTTRAVSHPHAGTARANESGSASRRLAVVTSPDKSRLPELRAQLARQRVVGGDPYLGRRQRDLAEYRLIDRGATRSLLERSRIRVRHPLEVVF